MRRAAMVIATVGALAAGLVLAPPTASAPVGPFVGVPVTLGPSVADDPPSPRLAGLADGTTAAVFIAPGYAELKVRVRAAGGSSWAPATTIALDSGWVVPAPGVQLLKPVVLCPAGPSEFLLVWQETNGGASRIRAQRLSRAGALVGGTDTIAGPGSYLFLNAATNASGRAVVLFAAPALSNAEFRVRTRATATSAWSSEVPTGQVSASPPGYWGFLSGVAVHDSGTVCVMFPTSSTAASPGALGSVTLRSKCAAPGALAAAAPQVVGTFNADNVTENVGVAATMVAGPSGFLVAGLVAAGGSAALPQVADQPATKVRVRVRPAGSGSWSTAATLGLAGELNLRPTALASTGGVAVHYLRVTGATGSDGVSPAYALDQMVAQQQGSDVWTPAQYATSIALSSGAPPLAVRATGASLGPAGEMLVPALQPVLPSGITSAFVRRSSWTGAFALSSGFADALPLASVVAASGRATALGRTSGANIVVAQTALPKPFVREAAAIPAAPAVGVASSCGFAFTDAASVSRQWLVGGVVRGTGSTYTPTAADRGRSLVCRVTGTNPTGSTVSTSPGRVVA